MKKLMLTGALLTIAACAFAAKDDKKDEKKSPATTQAAAVNKFCAVMGEHEIDPKVTLEYGGKTVGFCCADCIPDFKKDPEKYMKKLK